MLGVALVCLLIAVRPPGTVRVLEALPVLRHSLNFHSRVTLLLDLAVAYLAACTWERWRRGELALRLLLLPAAALAAAIAWAYLANPGPNPEAFARLRLGSLALQLATLAAALLLLAFRSTAWRAAGLVAVVAAELIALHGPAHPPVPAELYYPVLPPIALIQERLDPWHRMSGLGPALRPNFASVYGFADPRTSNPAKPADFVAAIERIDAYPGRATDGFVAPEDPLYQLLGVRFLITAPRTFLPKPYRLVSRGGGAWVYQNRLALPLFFLPAALQPCPAVTSWSDCTAGIPDFGALAAIHAYPLPIAGWIARNPAGSALDLGAVRPDHFHARARLAEPRLLASSVYQDGNWKLLLGGVRRRTTLANGPFVAAWLPAGEAGLDLLYRPGSFVAGLAVAALALAAGVGAWGAPQTARRSQARSVASE